VECPYCSFLDSKVTDSRTVDGAIRRRRECLRCGARFTTFERVEAPTVMVVKRDGRRESFSREKILTGVRRACEKRPLEAGEIPALVTRVQNRVVGLGQAEVASELIGELVMRELRDLDEIAYVRFASVYRRFTDIETLRAVLDELERSGPRVRRPEAQPPLLPQELLQQLKEEPRIVPLVSRGGRRARGQAASG
jgi:transcriptional repressor NrdR